MYKFTPPALMGTTPNFLSKLIAQIEALVAQYGPQAAPMIDALIAASGLPVWLIPIVEAIVNSLLNPPVK